VQTKILSSQSNPVHFAECHPKSKFFSAPILFIAFNSTNLDELIEKLHFLEKEEISYLFSTSKFQSASLEKSLFLQFLSHGVYNKMNVIQIGYNGLNYRIISNKAEKSFVTKNRFHKDGDEKLDGIILKILENVTLFNWNLKNKIWKCWDKTEIFEKGSCVFQFKYL